MKTDPLIIIGIVAAVFEFLLVRGIIKQGKKNAGKFPRPKRFN